MKSLSDEAQEKKEVIKERIMNEEKKYRMDYEEEKEM